MDNYTKLVHELIEQNIGEHMTWHEGATRADAIKHMADNGFEDLFGNISGSRTYSTHEAQQFIDEAGAVWDGDIRDMFDELGDEYFGETLKRGAETFDVVVCELLGQRELYTFAEAEGIDL